MQRGTASSGAPKQGSSRFMNSTLLVLGEPQQPGASPRGAAPCSQLLLIPNLMAVRSHLLAEKKDITGLTACSEAAFLSYCWVSAGTQTLSFQGFCWKLLFYHPRTTAGRSPTTGVPRFRIEGEMHWWHQQKFLPCCPQSLPWCPLPPLNHVQQLLALCTEGGI